MNEHIAYLMSVLPEVPTGTPAEIAKDALDFFSKWIGRAGGLIALVGFVKMALGFKEDSSRETLEGALVAISGLIIKASIESLDVFTTSPISADTEFYALQDFISKWLARLGGLALFLGAILLALGIKDNDAAGKVTGIKTIATGGVIIGLSAISVIVELT